MATLALYEDWKVGIHPVSLGLAPSITTAYRQAMRLCAVAIANRDADLLKG